MKKTLRFVIFFVIVFGLPCKSFAQLEGKEIYIYLRGDKLHVTFTCTNETPHISDLGATYCDAGGMKYLRINPAPPRTRAYWGKTGYKGVYVIKFITFGDHDPREIGERCLKQTWYFYESLNVITQISPSEINDKRDDIINDPWKYGEKAVYDRIYPEEFLKRLREKKESRKKEEE